MSQPLIGLPLFSGTRAVRSWPQLWDQAHAELKRQGYRRNTRRLYRHVLRSVSRQVRVAPAQVREWHLQNYLQWQARRGTTASWISANITVLRTVFDKLGGLSLTQHMVTPRRPWPLPYVLTLNDVRRILASAPTLRDQLLLGLLYGCGLKVGELCRLRWSDLRLTAGTSGSPASGLMWLSPTREMPIPTDLWPVLIEGLARCPATDYIFTGARTGKPISDRMVAIILRSAVKTARLEGPIDGMVMRHSYALHCLEGGVTVRELQERLGHRQVATTMIYLRLLHPGVVSPLDKLNPITPQPPPDTASTDSLHHQPLPINHASSAPLFPAPLTTAGLALPFATEPTGLLDAARAFCQALRTRFVGGFLALKRVIRSPA